MESKTLRLVETFTPGWVIVATALLVLALTAAPAAGESDVPRKTRESIASWNTAFEDAFARGDAATIAELFTEDAEIVESFRPPVRGRTAVRDYFEYFLEFGLEDLISRTDELHGDDETAVEIGRNVVVLPGGQRTTTRYMCLYRNVDGRWLAHRVYANSGS